MGFGWLISKLFLLDVLSGLNISCGRLFRKSFSVSFRCEIKQISLPLFDCFWFWRSICIQSLHRWRQYSILGVCTEILGKGDLYFKRRSRVSNAFSVPGELLEEHLANLCQILKLTQGWRSGTGIRAKFHTNRNLDRHWRWLLWCTWQPTSKHFQPHPT